MTNSCVLAIEVVRHAATSALGKWLALCPSLSEDGKKIYAAGTQTPLSLCVFILCNHYIANRFQGGKSQIETFISGQLGACSSRW
jgi:hypothetical protein